MMSGILKDIEKLALDRRMETGKHPELIRINPSLRERAESESLDRFDDENICGWNIIDDASVETFIIE